MSKSEKVSLLVSPVSTLVVEFVGRVCKASSSVFFSEGVPSGIRSSVCETGLSGLLARVLSGCPLTTKRTRKNSSREEEGINALCLVIGQLVAKSFGGSIDSRKEINLWLLYHPLLRRKAEREKDSTRKTKKGTFYT